MHWFNRMNRVIEYVDDHICDFDSNVISRIMACPYSVFLRTFAPITGISFSEYVRRRRLSRAAYELCNSSARIIDIALKYGYTSADAFSYAFKKQNGISPFKACRSSFLQETGVRPNPISMTRSTFSRYHFPSQNSTRWRSPAAAI